MKGELFFFLNNSGTVVVSDMMPRFGVKGELVANIPECNWTTISREGLKIFRIPRVPKDRVVKVEIETTPPLIATVERKVVAGEFTPLSQEEVKEKKKIVDEDEIDDDYDDEEEEEGEDEVGGRNYHG